MGAGAWAACFASRYFSRKRADVSFLVTLANCNAAAAHTRTLQLPIGGREPLRASLQTTELRASGIDPVATGKLGDIGNFTRGRPRVAVACQEHHDLATPAEWSVDWEAGVQCEARAHLAVQMVLAPFTVLHMRVTLVYASASPRGK